VAGRGTFGEGEVWLVTTNYLACNRDYGHEGENRSSAKKDELRGTRDNIRAVKLMAGLHANLGEQTGDRS